MGTSTHAHRATPAATPFDTRQDCTNPDHGPGWHPGTPPARCIPVLARTLAAHNVCGRTDCPVYYPAASASASATADAADDASEAVAAVRAAGIDPDLFAAYCSHQNVETTAEHLSTFIENYAGMWDSERDYAGSWLEDLKEQHIATGAAVPEPFASYVDIDAYACTMFSDVMFSILLPHGNVAVFRSH
ncbi:antirestriction protein ArdA [Quadrisphaera setariae]|uniref:Antirestriction protein ArdA n=1 Tax=Quadrisphaera setariae TaxID=2593304 RepID=A0A5C8Z5E7_9ACTN|nr:antirestriction protein ArdA [Quadrisphaera setariae]TXR52493.1 antirestriction protein ArdA [Quadrisphaera setariae]